MTKRRTGKQVGLAVVGVVALIAIGAAAYAHQQHSPPALLRGSARGTVTLVGEGATAALDAPRMVARVERLGGEATIESATGSRVRIRLSSVSSIADAEKVLRAGAFEMRALRALPEVELPVGVVRSAPQADRPDRWLSATCAALEAFATSGRAVGCLVGIQQPLDPASPCQGYCMEPTAVVTEASVVAAEAHPDDTWGWAVMRTFDARGRSAVASFTTAATGRFVAVLIDGRVTSAAIIVAPITAGTLDSPPDASSLGEVEVMAYASELAHDAALRYRDRYRVER